MTQQSFRQLLTTLFAVPVLLAGITRAEDVSYSVTARLEAYENRLAELESRLEAADMAAAAMGHQPDVHCPEVCCEPCRSSSVFVAAEALFFRYHRADGMRFDDDNNDSASSSLRASPRVAVGYVSPGGLGIRARYWEYEQFFNADNVNDGSGVSIDTYTIDLELFESIELNADWSLEISGGVRYNEFSESLLDVSNTNAPHLNDFSGWGGILALELRRCLFGNFAIFGRARGAVLMDDKFQIEDAGDDLTLQDSVVGVTELALGVEYRRCLLSNAVVFLRGSYEWQNWSNYSASFEDSDTSDDLSGPADVGFNGFAIQLGVER